MATVYILHSISLDRFYIGSCVNLDNRLEQHRNKTFKGSFTSKAEDWEIFFQCSDLHITQARKIEAHIKRMKSKKYINNLKAFPDMIDKLKLRYPFPTTIKN